MIEIYEKLIYTNSNGEGIEIGYSFPFFLQSIEGAYGTKNNIITTKSYNQDGSTIINESLNSRDIFITGTIKGDSKDEQRKYKQKLSRVFNPKLEGTLIYEYGNSKKIINCKISDSPTFSQEGIWKYQKFLIGLYCANPFWRDIENNSKDIALWKGDFGFELEFLDSGIEFGHREPSLIVNVNNNGDVESGMKIEFKALGTVLNPSLFSLNTREFIKINKEMKAGELITISTYFGDKRVESTLNGLMSNAFNFIDWESTFLQLKVGENLFRYDADSNVDNLEVNICYIQQYLGV